VLEPQHSGRVLGVAPFFVITITPTGALLRYHSQGPLPEQALKRRRDVGERVPRQAAPTWVLVGEKPSEQTIVRDPSFLSRGATCAKSQGEKHESRPRGADGGQCLATLRAWKSLGERLYQSCSEPPPPLSSDARAWAMPGTMRTSIEKSTGVDMDKGKTAGVHTRTPAIVDINAAGGAWVVRSSGRRLSRPRPVLPSKRSELPRAAPFPAPLHSAGSIGGACAVPQDGG